jgi:DNA primase
MDIQRLKQYIYENDLIEIIANQLGMHDIKWHDNKRYLTCAWPDGDNKNGCVIYNSEYLNVEANTRDLGNKVDLISVVEFVNKINFFNALKWISECIGLNYYYNFDKDLPESLQITNMIEKQRTNNIEEDNIPVKPIDPTILTYYQKCGNIMWYEDGVDYETQEEFELGYDPFTNRITIPIYNEINDLVGVKGRLFKPTIEDWEMKYLYIESCPRSKILYGLYKTDKYIKELGKCFCFEAEKSTHQLWSYGYKNSIAFGGKKISQHQIKSLERLSIYADIVLCMDKDVEKNEIEKVALQFADGIPIYYIWDNDNVLNEKESPSDNKEKFEKLIRDNIYKIK